MINIASSSWTQRWLPKVLATYPVITSDKPKNTQDPSKYKK